MLTDVNGGQKILLRLRPAWAPDTFYDEEQLVAVMLHEVSAPELMYCGRSLNTFS